MSFLVTCSAFAPDGSCVNGARVRWRSDDLWGTLWRAMYKVCYVHFPGVPPEKEKEDMDVLAINMAIRYEADRDHFCSPRFQMPLYESLFRLGAKLPSGA